MYLVPLRGRDGQRWRSAIWMMNLASCCRICGGAMTVIPRPTGEIVDGVRVRVES